MIIEILFLLFMLFCIALIIRKASMDERMKQIAHDDSDLPPPVVERFASLQAMLTSDAARLQYAEYIHMVGYIASADTREIDVDIILLTDRPNDHELQFHQVYIIDTTGRIHIIEHEPVGRRDLEEMAAKLADRLGVEFRSD